MTKTNKIIALTLFTIITLSQHAGAQTVQDYTLYYQKMDSAKYFLSINETEKALKLENYALLNFKGFPDDYEAGIRNYYKVNHVLNKEYIIKGFQCCMHTKDLFYFLKKDSIPFSKHEIKKMKRKYRLRKSVRIMPLLRMLRKDQKARKKPGSLLQTDSLNALRLIKLYHKKPWLFNRFKTGYIGSQLLKPLLIHQHWNYIGPLFPDLHDMVKKGLIPRDDLVYMLERNACLGGYVFNLDSSKNTLQVTLQLNDTLCNKHFYYSSFGDLFKYVHSDKGYYLIPVNPSINPEKLNALRKFMLMSDIDLFRKSNLWKPYLPEAEFCEKVKSTFNRPIPLKK